MVYCSYCGQLNDYSRSFDCAGCGANLPRAADYAPRQAYPPSPIQPAYVVPIVPVVPYFRCRFCQTTYPPQMRQKISVAGWIIFAFLLLFCFPLCFIGLLMKEDYRVCSVCGILLG